jgi:hypothetical protein
VQVGADRGTTNGAPVDGADPDSGDTVPLDPAEPLGRVTPVERWQNGPDPPAGELERTSAFSFAAGSAPVSSAQVGHMTGRSAASHHVTDRIGLSTTSRSPEGRIPIPGPPAGRTATPWRTREAERRMGAHTAGRNGTSPSTVNCRGDATAEESDQGDHVHSFCTEISL